jgi:diguanylate cyclase (GGDEF)-like protein
MAKSRGTIGHFGGLLNRRLFAVTVVIVALWAILKPPVAQASDINVRVDAPAGTRTNAVFVVHVLAPGTPILLVPGGKPHIATLEVDGALRQTVGTSAAIGSQPLGGSLLLDGVTPRSRVVVRVIDGDGELHVAGDVGLLSTAARDGLLNGMYLAFLLFIAAVHAVIGTRSRERTNLWYTLWALSIFAVSVTREGFLGSGALAPVVAITTVVIAVASTGFITSYLRLRVRYPWLFRAVIGANVAAPLTPLLVNAVAGGRIDGVFLLFPLVGVASTIPASVVRWRDGFGPAGILVVGTSALFATFAVEFVLFATGRSELVSTFAVNLATTFDFAIFAAALGIRGRYVASERAALEARLDRSEYDARHDSLTGLLNRRGLEAWLRDTGQAPATLFFIDLDRFKAVNDGGGHAAGDEALRAVSRIIRNAVRDVDVVARIGGDEFLVAFVDPLAPDAVERVRADICARVADLRPLGDENDTRIGASVGVGAIGSDTPTFEEALRAADTDAYRVKLERAHV